MNRKTITVRKSFLILALILPLCFFNSCASAKKSQAAGPFRPVYITNSKKVKLLSPEKAALVFDGVQLLNGSFGSQSFSLLSYTQIDERGISLSLMNDFGADMGNLFYDASTLAFDSAYFPKTLPGEYIICDIQNAYYSEEALRNNYEAAGLRFEVSTQEENGGELLQTRRIYDGKKLIEEITLSKYEVTIKNILRGYSYQLVNTENF